MMTGSDMGTSVGASSPAGLFVRSGVQRLRLEFSIGRAASCMSLPYPEELNVLTPVGAMVPIARWNHLFLNIQGLHRPMKIIGPTEA